MDNNDALKYENDNLKNTANLAEKLIYYSVSILVIVYNLKFLNPSFQKLATLNTIIGISIIILVFIWNNILRIKNLRLRIYIEQILLTIIIFFEMGLSQGGYNPLILALPIIIIITVTTMNSKKYTIIYTSFIIIGYLTLLTEYFHSGFNQIFAITTELWATLYVVLGIYTYLKIYRNINNEYIEEIQFREQTEKLNNEKSAFAKVIESHLSSPIKTINNQIDSILNLNVGKDEKENIKDTFNKIKTNASTLKSLSENILNLDILNIQDITFNFQKIDITKLIQNTIDTMNIKAKEKNISILFNKNEQIYINVDIQRMGEILRNLIDNAIKYTNEGGKIVIDVNKGKDKKTYITVKDNGIGIPKNDIPHLFEKFYRASNVASNTNQGYGIGLYLIKQYIEKMSGTIDIQSSEGEGTTFTLSFN